MESAKQVKETKYYPKYPYVKCLQGYMNGLCLSILEYFFADFEETLPEKVIAKHIGSLLKYFCELLKMIIAYNNLIVTYLSING